MKEGKSIELVRRAAGRFELPRRQHNLSHASPSGRSPARNRRKLSVELLEDRTLLAVRTVGAVDPATTFPAHYSDSNGLALALCLDNLPECGPPAIPDPAAPVSFPDNFPDESFYFRAVARMPTNGVGRATLVLAQEAAVLNAIVPGDQITFNRLRIRADGLVPGATYTVTHPYGADTFVANALGAINNTDQVGCAALPCNFALATGGRADPFLRWDPAVAPAPLPGFIGSFAVEHRVVGSPRGTNFFRIDGPDVGGPGVNSIQTDLFAVIGKIHPAISGMTFDDLNGNGVNDPGEPGLAGWTITVAGRDAAGRAVNVTTSTLADDPATPANEAGNYSFFFGPGTYAIRETPQAGWVQSAPALSPAGRVYNVTLAAGQVAGNQDFGNFRLGTIQGMAFEDLNKNGVNNPFDPGLAGWTIVLNGADGMGNPVNVTTTTPADGTYSFAGLVPGTYTVSEVVQQDWVQTAPASGAYNVTLTSGQTAAGKDFGNVFGQVAVLQADPSNPGMSVLRVIGTRGNDKISVSKSLTNLNVTINLHKFGPFSINGLSRIIARGLDGNDSISVSAAVKLPAWLDGGAGNDNLTGGGGRDILVGGVGLDHIKGASNDDIMIAGSWTGGTTIDAFDSALAAVMREWSSPTPYADRVARLSSGAPGLPALNSTTVLGDGVVDTLSDGAGFDWFFREPQDKILLLVKSQAQTIAPEG